MDDYLSKPVDRRVLEATIGRWLRAVQSGVMPAPAVSPVVSAPPPVMAPPPLTATPAPAPVPRPALQVVAPPLAPPPTPRQMPETIVAPPPPRPVPSVVMPPAPPRPAPPAALPPRQPPPVLPPYPSNPVQRNFPPAAAPSAPQTTVAPPAAPPVLPVLAMEIVDELRAVMGPEYVVLIKLFLEDAPNHIQKLEAAAASNNIEAMVAPAHTLKSSSANLGALALSAVAKRIEIGARSEALPRPTVAVVMLENEFERAQLALTALMQ